MRTGLLIPVLLLSVGLNSQAQNNTINQNQQNVNINLPIIEKTVYVDRYRTVYVDRPQQRRIARKLDAPIQLLGFLWVYPEDLGHFKQPPYQIIQSLNELNSYGHNNWRIPTPDELAVLEANADKVGLGDDIYLATDHANGVLRLVARPDTKEETAAKYNGVLVGNIVWSNKNIGANSNLDPGDYYWLNDVREACPAGWRLPTKQEFIDLQNSGKMAKVGFPTPQEYDGPYNPSGEYWTSTIDYSNPRTNAYGQTVYPLVVAHFSLGRYGLSLSFNKSSSTNMIRCVKDL